MQMIFLPRSAVALDFFTHTDATQRTQKRTHLFVLFFFGAKSIRAILIGSCWKFCSHDGCHVGVCAVFGADEAYVRACVLSKFVEQGGWVSDYFLANVSCLTLLTDISNLSFIDYFLLLTSLTLTK